MEDYIFQKSLATMVLFQKLLWADGEDVLTDSSPSLWSLELWSSYCHQLFLNPHDLIWISDTKANLFSCFQHLILQTETVCLFSSQNVFALEVSELKTARESGVKVIPRVVEVAVRKSVRHRPPGVC